MVTLFWWVYILYIHTCIYIYNFINILYVLYMCVYIYMQIMGLVPLNGLMRTFWTTLLPDSLCTAHSSFPPLHIYLHIFLSISETFFNQFAVPYPLLSKIQPPSLLLLLLCPQGLPLPTWALVAAALGVPWPSLGSQGCHTSADVRVCFQNKNWTMKSDITLALKSLYS